MTILSAVVQGLASAVAEGLVKALMKKPDCNFEEELQSMNRRLVDIKGLLEKNENCDEPAVKATLAAFRDVMYEADDILTDCLIRQEDQKKRHLCNLSLFNVFSGNSQAAARKIQDLNRGIDDTKNILGKHLTAGGSSGLHGGDTEELRRYYEQSDEIFGIGDQVEKLKGWIICKGSDEKSDYKLEKIVIVGMGGLGKTTIADVIFNDSDVMKHFDRNIKVVVSHFTEEDVGRSILEKLGEKSGEQPSELGGHIADEMLNQIISRLEQESCLIILDDIWDNDHFAWWKNKFFPRLSNSTLKKTCIIVTTRDHGVASKIGVHEDRVHEPPFLEENDGLLLFSKYALASIDVKNESRRKIFEEEGKKIVAKCGGLPLAIKTIGALLGSEPNSSLAGWKRIWESFREPISQKENIVMNSLELSYKALPLPLKQCLLYFSVFPEDYKVQAERLVHWWIGEGLVQGTKSKTATEMGFEHLSKLVSRCLVEAVERRGYDGAVYSCKMHDMVRDFTLLKAKDEQICSFDQNRQHFSDHSRWWGLISATEAKSFKASSKLRALLLMFGDQAIIDINLGSFHSLRALDLSNNDLDSNALKDLFKLIISLERLAYLNLSGAKGLKEIPKSISKLRVLQLLVLNGCVNLSKLSPSVTDLKRLLVLDLESCGLKYLPHGLGTLCKLQELSGFCLERPPLFRNSCSLHELGELSELRVLRMQLSEDSKVRNEDSAVISKLKKLKVLAIDFNKGQWKEDTMFQMLDKLSPPSELKELSLRHYYHNNLPKWFSPEHLCNLEYLCMEDGHMTDISTDACTSWKVEGLRLKVVPLLKMEWYELIEKKMPILRYAEVSGCYGLANFPYPMDDINVQAIWRRSKRPEISDLHQDTTPQTQNN